ncbi:prenyltransferase/squalene oxidase repeat-containing protein [Rhodopirellula sp. SWK7]|uniref:prenyltransferase/squalene oxidase repeat-containing protein n=1 Tax=Rhodopirellula sp. SWK7 TaxID=595460 RepID=UPI0002C0055D|nr:prenyltransferase/squalene oxidase repeat-containing protein [Rhodopirellula sp. SWK7]EMI43415.1 secreted protein [Rhodopirellula sp. SWK7]
MHHRSTGLSRRELFHQGVAWGASIAACSGAHGSDSVVDGWHSRVEVYLAGHARPDHGYGWEDQQESHLTPTHAVIGCLHHLEALPSDTEDLESFVRTHHPAAWKRLEQEHRDFEFQQIQALSWLGADISDFAAVVSGWESPVPYLPQYEKHRYPVFRFQLKVFTCRALLGMSLNDLSPEWIAYLDGRRRENGSFNNTPANQGGEGHVLNTLWGLEALESLGREDEQREDTAKWLQSCQAPSGGFRWCPEPPFAHQEDIAYCWAAVRGLWILQSQPTDAEALIGWIHSCFNEDGGFGDRPGWRSNPVATFYAIDALKELGVLDQPLSRDAAPQNVVVKPSQDLKVFSCQVEAHGQGSPADAVRLAESLKIHLWGAKNSEPGWIEASQRIADQQKVQVTFFRANEEYGTWVDVPGLGTYSHTSDVIAPADGDMGESLADQGDLPWTEFRRRRLSGLKNNDGRLIWQFGENEEITRLLLDDSLQQGGFAAISTFHFGNPDFTNSEPFLKRYAGQLPFIALQDAHGIEPWWFADKTNGFRTLFLAKEPTWEGWLTALQNCWTAPVRHDEVTENQLRMHPGSRFVADVVIKQHDAWRWWDNPAISRPMVSLAVIRSEDRYEVASPEKGVNLRVRCAHRNAARGQLKDPLAEFVSLSVDGEPVQPEFVERWGGRGGNAGRGQLVDRYHLWRMPEIRAGYHQATAVVRSLESNDHVNQTIKFRVV